MLRVEKNMNNEWQSIVIKEKYNYSKIHDLGNHCRPY